MPTDDYALGVDCQWHGPPTDSMRCPVCRGPLALTNRERVWMDIRKRDRQYPKVGFLRMMVWSEGKCFETADEMAGAWRQHETGRE